MEKENEIEGNHWGHPEEEQDDPSVNVAEEEQSNTDSGGVSPVFGVILMVCVTVDMAAIIGTFILDLSSGLSQEENNKPSVVVEKNTSTDEIIVTVESIPSDYKYVTVEGPGTKSQIVSGQTFTFENPPENASITVTGTYETASGMYSEPETRTILLYDAEISLE